MTSLPTHIVEQDGQKYLVLLSVTFVPLKPEDTEENLSLIYLPGYVLLDRRESPRVNIAIPQFEVVPGPTLEQALTARMDRLAEQLPQLIEAMGTYRPTEEKDPDDV